ncbi:hypothetical protein OEZ85_007697 [Tetradesmus obliquus]|uniref:At4g15545-like C-terminal domain-containing protein n=1 Tax=Tetradesmus obliquus TaxID=3088 RepID=A0ABY8TL72_TETOB|nr:hypothetical protein OEZ85_007697 [Tetradesmus obliquus]
MADTYTSDCYVSPESGSLPGEVLAVLPTDAYLQLELAYKITCHAYGQQVSRLEHEGRQMQETLSQNQQVIKSLERRVAGLESEMHDHQQRARQGLAEQHKLVAEKNALIETVKRLNREVAKLEHFKKNLLQQLQDDDEADCLPPSMAAVDQTTERLVAEVLQSADGIAAAAASSSIQPPNTQQYSQQQQPRYIQQQYSEQQHCSEQQPTQQQQQQQEKFGQQQQQRFQPSSKVSPAKGLQAGALTAGGGRRHGSPGSSPNQQHPYAASHFQPIKSAAVASAPTSPYRQRGGPAISPQRPAAAAAADGGSGGGISTQMGGAVRFAVNSSGAGSTPSRGGTAGGAAAAAAAAAGAAAAGRAAAGVAASGGGRGAASPRIDGKEFFRQARARLSYEQFSQFLVAIKELNAGRSSREDTLGAARALFGPANGDLYGLFEGLLMRHLTSL